MAVKDKIGASLRKSVSAEKQKAAVKDNSSSPVAAKAANLTTAGAKLVVAKPAAQAKKVGRKPKASAAKPRAAAVKTKATTKTRAATKTRRATTKTRTATKAADKTKNSAKSFLDAARFNNQELLNSLPLSGLQDMFEQVTTVGSKLTNLFLENLRETQESLNHYLAQLPMIKNPANLYDLNLQLLNKLKSRQQYLFSKNLDIFSFIHKNK